jgi:tetratricopeptide (TPR) repeat protein
MAPSETLQELLDRATALIEQGQADEGLLLYLHVLELDPAYLVTHLQQQDRIEETELLLDEALARKPYEPRLIKLRAFFHFDKGQYEEALAACERMIPLKPNDETSLQWRVTSLRELERFDEARQAAEEALQNHPQSTYLLNELGFILDDQEQDEEALAAFEQTLSIDPNNETALQWRIISLQKLGRIEEARQALEKALRIQPRSTRLLNELGFLHENENQHEEALAAFEQALSVDPSDETALPKRVTILRRLKRLDEARKAVEEALRHFPRNTDLLNERGILLMGQELYEEALAAFEQTLSITPNDKAALEGRTICLRGLRRFDEARQAAEAALQLFPRSTRLLNELGLLYHRQGRHEEALATFERTLSIAPRHQAALVLRTTTLRVLRRFAEAREAVEAALRLHPQNSHLQAELGLLLQHQGQHAEALAAFERTLSIAPGNETALTRRVSVLRRLRRLEEAKQAAEEALRQLPQNIRLLNELGLLLGELRRHEEVLAVLARVLAITPDHEHALTKRATALRQLRRFEEARQAAEEGLRRLSQSTRLQNELGQLLMDQGQYEKALAAFAKTLSIAPNDEAAHRCRVICLRQLRRFPEAQKALEAALKELPRSTLLMNQRGFIHYDQQRYEVAYSTFDELTRADPANTYAQLMKSVCLRRLRRYEEAANVIDAAFAHAKRRAPLLYERGWLLDNTGRLAEAEAAFAEAMNEDPNFLLPIFARAEALDRLGRSLDGLQLIQSLESRFPGDPIVASDIGWFHLSRNEPLKARRKFEELPRGDELREAGLGGVSFALKNYADAEAHFSHALSIDPWSASHHANIAWAFLRQDDDASLLRAEQHCLRALDFDREYPKALGCLGVIAFRRGHFRESEDWFLTSLRASPNRGSYSDLGALYVQTGRYAEAKKQLEHAIALDANDVRAWIEFGNLHWQLGEKKEALHALRRAVAIDPDSDDPYRALAVVLMQMGELTEAENLLRQGLQRLDDPERWRLHLTLAQVIRAIADRGNDRKLYEEALQALRLSLRVKDEIESHFELGLILAKLEDYEGALFEFQKCLHLDEQHVEARRNAVRLRTAIRERRVQTRGSAFGTWILGIGSIAQLIGVWFLYLRGALDAKTLVIFIPILIGISAVGVLLPWLTRLKLPGIEAELTQAKQSISSGPTGDIGLTSPMPSITQGPK